MDRTFLERMTAFIFLLIVALIVLTGCAGKENMEGSGDMERSYTMISQGEALNMMRSGENVLILDVRRMDEYEAGHIPGAICIPNESIGGEKPVELPDLDQKILVYCRSGNRSKQASEKLVKIGYTSVYEFGGILDWKYDTVTGRSPYGEDMTPVAVMCVRIGVKQFTADLEDNSSSDAFLEKLKGGELNLVMEDYGSFEKVADLPWSLPRNDKRITTEPGDIILYQGDKLTIYYAENTWEFTRIGKIHIDSYEDFRDALGDGSAEVSFWLEWTE